MQLYLVPDDGVQIAVDAALFRPASVLRRTRQRALIEAISAAPLDVAGAAALLKCSSRAAYCYLNELSDAFVIEQFHGSERSVLARKRYRLHPDARHACSFLAALAALAGPDRRAQAPLPYRRQLHLVMDDVARHRMAPVLPATRDPLVAALFGAKG